MATGQRYAGIFSKQIIGDILVSEYLVKHVKDHVDIAVGRAIGEAVFDSGNTGDGIVITTTKGSDAIGERRMSLTNDRWCQSLSGNLIRVGDGSLESDTEGSRTIVKHDPDWFASLPYQNQDGTTYYVYVGKSYYPVDVSIAKDGTIGYSNWIDVPGFSVNPNSVVDDNGNIELRIDANITSLGMQRWNTANHSDNDWSYDCVVWIDTNTPGATIKNADPDVAIAYGAKLQKIDPSDGDGWRINLTGIGDGKLGQSSISTDASHYRICVLGPIVTNSSALQSDEEYVFIGTVASTTATETEDVSGQLVIIPFSSFTSGFNVEHVSAVGSDLGRHTSVTAPEDQDLDISVDAATDQVITVSNIGAGSMSFVVDGELHVDEIISRTNVDMSVTFDVAGVASMIVENVDSGNYAQVVSGRIVADLTNDGVGDVVAYNEFDYPSARTVTEFSVVDSVKAFYSGHIITTETVVYDSGGSPTTVNAVVVQTGVSGEATILVPVSFPDDFEVQKMHLTAFRTSSGSPVVYAELAYWDKLGLRTDIPSTRVTSTASDAFEDDTEDLVLSTNEYTIQNTIGRQYYIKIYLRNNGSLNNTARFARVTVEGQPSKVRSLGF